MGLNRMGKTIFALLVVALIVTTAPLAMKLAGPHKENLPRDDVYYEIQNDAGDHGNYIETYHLHNGRGGTVYCVVYSDKIGDGGGAGISCDWARSR